MAKETPAAEIDVTEDLVRSLVDSQFPQYGPLALSLVGNGWDNSIYRLGNELSVRMPRRALAAPLILNEQRWLPEISQRLSVPIPAPLAFGVPDDDYPWHWSVVRWFAGETAAASGLVPGEHSVLASFLNELHQPAPRDAPENPYRGIPLRNRHDITIKNLNQLARELEPAKAELGFSVATAIDAWDQAVAIPAYNGPPVWLHGDLHPLNVVTAEKRIVAVIDFGDITSGDPATDISAGFMLFDRDSLLEFKTALGCDENTWGRARGWAISLGLTYLAHSGNSPPMEALGQRTLEAASGSES